MDNNNLIVNRKIVNDSEDHNDKNKNKEETIGRFASVFPDWDLTPPAILVRRVRRKI